MSPHDQVLQSMKEMVQKLSGLGVTLALPPTSSQTLGTEYTQIEMGTKLAAKFQFNPLMTNPLGMFQGGLLCALFDEVFGPLTYMAANQPVVTLEMSTTFVRPFMAKDEWITITGEVVSKTKTVLVLKGEARTKDGKLVATANNLSLVVSENHLKSKS